MGGRGFDHRGRRARQGLGGGDRPRAVLFVTLGVVLGLIVGFAPPDPGTEAGPVPVAQPGIPTPSSGASADPHVTRTEKPPSPDVSVPAEPPITPEPVPTVHAPSVPLVGSLVANARTGRPETVVQDVRRTAVLIGDSQAAGADTWPQLALTALGYSVSFSGGGGTGYVASNPVTGAPNYLDGLTAGTWVLPHGDPALVVVVGGGNDAGAGATDEQIRVNVDALLRELRLTYPASQLVMVGTLSRSPSDGGGRRSEVDALLGGLAVTHAVPFVPAGDWLTTHRLEDLLIDDVHLGPEGHARASTVLEAGLVARKLDPSYTAGRLTSRRADVSAAE